MAGQRGCSYPGSAEVVNMQPPDSVLKAGVKHLPTVGDIRKPLDPERFALVGRWWWLGISEYRRYGLSRFKRAYSNALVDEKEWAARRANWTTPELHHQTPWQEIYCANVGQLAEGGCLELAPEYQ